MKGESASKRRDLNNPTQAQRSVGTSAVWGGESASKRRDLNNPIQAQRSVGTSAVRGPAQCGDQRSVGRRDLSNP